MPIPPANPRPGSLFGQEGLPEKEEPNTRIPNNTRIQLTEDATKFRVLRWRAHATQPRGEYLLQNLTGRWRFWADAAKVEKENPEALKET